MRLHHVSGFQLCGIGMKRRDVLGKESGCCSRWEGDGLKNNNHIQVSLTIQPEREAGVRAEKSNQKKTAAPEGGGRCRCFPDLCIWLEVNRELIYPTGTSKR